MAKKDWFRPKKYPHIGLPLSFEDRSWVEKYVSNPNKVSKHAFLPFIHKTSIVRKFRKKSFPCGKRTKHRFVGKKERELFYASHLDSNIYSYYAAKLAKLYEIELQNQGITDNITGYRRIPVNSDSKENKCNIDFANELFCHIRNHKEKKLIAISFDIKSFFDNLDHKILKQAWYHVVKSRKTLEKDHYNVFRNITKFSYINARDIFEEFKEEIWVENKLGERRQKKIKRSFNLKNHNAIAFCKEKDIIRLRRKNYIKSNKRTETTEGQYVLRQKGIPQGSPISAILSNMYMLDFDKQASLFIDECQGFYRRYSDDMVVVCKPKHMKDVINFFTAKIKEYKLEIQPQKTQVFYFHKIKNRFHCFEKNLLHKNLQTNTFFDYLGFSFDGHSVMLKSASLATYHRKMKRAIKRGYFYSSRIDNSTKGEFFKGRLYKQYTERGAKRRYVYKRDSKNPSQFIVSKKYNWGNYLTYTKKASKRMANNKIQSQTKKHWKLFHDSLGNTDDIPLLRKRILRKKKEKLPYHSIIP
jgi:hypothetical protein